jgi:hypothetical protein
MLELSARQTQILERLLHEGFRLIAIPPYEGALCVRRENCAALLAPSPDGGLRLLAPPAFLVDGNLSVRIRRGDREWFVWKKKEMEATPERRAELEAFRARLVELLEEAARPPA